MNEGQKKYDKFIQLVKEAYTGLSKEKVYSKGQELWRKVKNEPDEYNKIVLNLKTMATKSKSQNSKIWMGFISPPQKRAKVNVQNVGVDSEEQSGMCI